MNWESVLTSVRRVLATELFEIAGTTVTLATALTSLAILLLTLGISKVLRRGVKRAFALRGVTDEGTVAVVSKLLHYVVLFVGFGIALETLGIDLAALFAAGAVFAVGIGFAMQTVAQNFVSGVILLGERSITPGDVLEVDGQIVRVVKMGIRSTQAVTLDGEDLLLPNSMLVQNQVKNLTLDNPAVRVSLIVGVTYGSDMAQVQTVLERVAHEKHDEKAPGEPAVFLTLFNSSSVDFEVAVWTTSPWRMRKLKSELHHAVWDALKEAGVVIAFPQLDLHLDPDAQLRIRQAS
ncbi:MAG TPA: mechanosensitive ion channel [Polyangiaceae bacterium LLY-WYZ-15_(1-7)]|nr:hypothetical protein [Myxococcales bacterium]MAT27419.1 hypothetical protein [Sandaracinus sp.]HJK89250.1 mechanosensitive ion channel [Polyangiaceae bacterium LLY-WYZ-15_(1-7)]MBJ74569.1 hypothetical protein [Sandaracinus sp.]HJL05572.1 mechanosensitive ion channel [Polyangiaceae bacterium LLY-WYZ-15_(1-7)]